MTLPTGCAGSGPTLPRSLSMTSTPRWQRAGALGSSRGDGSLGHVAAASARVGLPLAVIPTGTANDFARAAGIPLDTDEAVRIAVAGNEARRFDIAHMDESPFLNVASFGLSPKAAEHASGLEGTRPSGVRGGRAARRAPGRPGGMHGPL